MALLIEHGLTILVVMVVMRNDVKETFPLISKEIYNSSAMSMQCTNTGDQRFGTFYWLYCTYCIIHFLPTALDTKVTS